MVQTLSASSRKLRYGAREIDGYDVLLNASPVGMLEDERLPLDVERLSAGLVVVDAVVKPERTPLEAPRALEKRGGVIQSEALKLIGKPRRAERSGQLIDDRALQPSFQPSDRTP